MNLTFRQGIVKYPQSGSLQDFLVSTASGVTLKADNGSIMINFAHGASNYVFEEFNTITDAWQETFISGNEYWLYWDIDTISGVRSFHYTTLPPMISSTQPIGVSDDQHWYDLSTNTMKVFNGSVWRVVIRVFAAYYDGANFTPLGSNVINFPFAGSQVGLSNTNVVAGKILTFNDSPIINKNREFFTTESIFNTNGTDIDTLRLESNFIIKKANETIPKYHVVRMVDDYTIELANYADIQHSIFAMATEDMLQQEIGNVILSGIVTNPTWSFTEIGQNLWVDVNGELVNDDPHNVDNVTNPLQFPPVAKVLSSDSIVFNPSYLPNVDVIPTINPATTTVNGVVTLSTTPNDANNPIVASDTDPRLSDARTPLPHIHDAEDVTFASNSGMISTNVEAGLDELNTDPRMSDARTPLSHVHDAEDVTFTSNSGMTSINVEDALDELNVDPRMSNARTPLSHVHDAQDVTFFSNTGMISTNVEAGLDELNVDPRMSDARTPLSHVHDAEDVTFTSNSGMISTNVEDALDELNGRNLASLNDVDSALSPVNDDVLYFDSTSSTWKSKQVTGGSGGASGSPYTFIDSGVSAITLSPSNEYYRTTQGFGTLTITMSPPSGIAGQNDRIIHMIENTGLTNVTLAFAGTAIYWEDGIAPTTIASNFSITEYMIIEFWESRIGVGAWFGSFRLYRKSGGLGGLGGL